MKKVSKQMRKMEAADRPEMTVGLDLGDRYSHYCPAESRAVGAAFVSPALQRG
jgi:hypothetical protein